VHCSDLHIDSPFKGISAAKTSIGEELREATFAAFRNVIDLTIDSKADFLVVAGDVYDGADRSVRAQLAFYDGLKELAEHGIRSYVAHGNHDPLAGWASSIQWPAEVKIFGGRIETDVVFRDQVPIASVSGVSYRTAQEDKNLAQDFRQATVYPDILNVAVLHCNVGSDSRHANYAPCTLKDLSTQKFNYWALGHVHDTKILCEGPYVVYPGNTQGRSMRELGPRGCYLVEVNDAGNYELEFVETDLIRWAEVSVSIDKVLTVDQLDHLVDIALVKLLNQSSRKGSVVCRIELIGRGPLYHELVHENSLNELLNRARSKYQNNKQFCWVEDIVLSCKSELSIEESRKREDLVGFVLREAEDLRKHDIGEQLGEVLNPVFQHSLSKGVLKKPTQAELEKLLEEAEIYCADLLEPN